jgi:hypothetical protein
MHDVAPFSIAQMYPVGQPSAQPPALASSVELARQARPPPPGAVTSLQE